MLKNSHTGSTQGTGGKDETVAMDGESSLVVERSFWGRPDDNTTFIFRKDKKGVRTSLVKN